MTPKDIIERETWSCDDHWLEVPDGERTKSVSLAETPITDGVCLDHNSTDAARARVAACAPETLRLLLKAADCSDEEYCIGCGLRHARINPDVYGEMYPHDPSCKLLLLLQKAGVR
jgi:MoaA/NifB/PqqE/SkfB family radical SAM enzyme